MSTHMKEMGSSSSSSIAHSWTYHVFLSFRGKDTRNNFTGHLYKALNDKGIHTFMDDPELKRGEEISVALPRAIEDSKISIIVFSENYASSTWCLDELVKILECKESKQQVVVPVFYKVDPFLVRHQGGNFGEAFARHESKFKNDVERVHRWRKALQKAADLSGCHYAGDRSESQFISKIVEEISLQMLKGTYLAAARNPVGLDSSMQSMMGLLDIDNKQIGVRMVGIWGPGGIGKTTLAKSVYNSVAYKYDGSCFLENVRENSVVYIGLVQLQETLLFNILGDRKLKVTSLDMGVSIIKERLREKKILLVLDDVSSLKQLENLAQQLSWFGSGSRIIITTRDMHLLAAHQVDSIYEVKKLDDHEALQVFSWNAFKQNEPLHAYKKLTKRALEYAQGLPLALKVVGSYLYGRSIKEWESALDSYERIPNKEIQGILKISYDALEENAKEVFLDIACFFKDKLMNYVIHILEGCDLFPVIGIPELEEKALITIDPNKKILMHDLIQEMGKEIVRQESPHEPGERSRLWFHKDVEDVLTNNTGTNKVRGIMLKLPNRGSICLSSKSFEKMINLKIFINFNAYLLGNVDHLSNKLRLLAWPEYPLQSLPSGFHPDKLVMLHMPFSDMTQLEKGSFEGVKIMNLVGCTFLTHVPDVSGMPNLETLYLDLCTHLVEVHDSVGRLQKLVTLSLIVCSELEKFPRKISLISLESIDLTGCRKLGSFPEIEGNMDSLRRIYLGETNIKELPASFGSLTGLQELHMDNCWCLTKLPDSIYNLEHLKYLSLDLCSKLVAYPADENSQLSQSADCGAFTNLATVVMGGVDSNFISQLFVSRMTPDCLATICTLDLSSSEFKSLPLCIGDLVNLSKLDLNFCMWLTEIPVLPSKLGWLDVANCGSLKNISELPDLFLRIEWINLSNCVQLSQVLDYEGIMMEKILLNQESSMPFELGAVVLGSEVPKWFSHVVAPHYLLNLPFDHPPRQLVPVFELSIQIPVHFKWENTGMAFCVGFLYKYVKSNNEGRVPTGWKMHLKAQIHISKVHIGDYEFRCCPSLGKDSMWLHYVPLPVKLKPAVDIESKFGESSPNYQCTVKFFCLCATEGAEFYLRKCGIHILESHNGVITAAVDDSSKVEYLHRWSFPLPEIVDERRKPIENGINEDQTSSSSSSNKSALN